MNTNITLLMNSTNFFDVVGFSNTATGGLFWFLILVAVFFVMIISLRRFGVSNATLASCFVCLVASALFYYVGLINVLVPIGFGVGIPVIIFYKKYTGE